MVTVRKTQRAKGPRKSQQPNLQRLGASLMQAFPDGASASWRTRTATPPTPPAGTSSTPANPTLGLSETTRLASSPMTVAYGYKSAARPLPVCLWRSAPWRTFSTGTRENSGRSSVMPLTRRRRHPATTAAEPDTSMCCRLNRDRQTRASDWPAGKCRISAVEGSTDVARTCCQVAA